MDNRKAGKRRHFQMPMIRTAVCVTAYCIYLQHYVNNDWRGQVDQMRISHLLTLLLLAALSCSASTVYTVGFEDWSGPTSDRDFNDTVIQITGVHFETSGVWVKPNPLQYPNETPYPYDTAFYFTDAIADGGPIVATLLFHQTAAFEVAYENDISWIAVTGTTTISNATIGDHITFRLIVNPGEGQTILYPDARLNADGLSHAIEQSNVPEPATFGMIGTALIGLALIRRKRHN